MTTVKVSRFHFTIADNHKALCKRVSQSVIVAFNI
jgi:hypothetical protein